jgi:hypothetical protein
MGLTITSNLKVKSGVHRSHVRAEEGVSLGFWGALVDLGQPYDQHHPRYHIRSRSKTSNTLSGQTATTALAC